MTAEPLDLAVRAFTHHSEDTARPSTKTQGAGPLPKSTDRFPEHVLIFDTETTIDEAQQLNFGAWRYCRVVHGSGGVELRCLQEGIFYADDLPQRDPAALTALTQYTQSHGSAVDAGDPDASPAILLQSQSEFCERVLFRVSFRLRAAVVCFNFPFDISRIAWSAGYARNKRPGKHDAFEGGFSFALFSYMRDGQRHEGRHRPRIAVKSIDSKRALKVFRSPEKLDADDLIPDGGDGKPDRAFRFRGNLLDLRTLVFALTDRSHSLESACDAFEVPYAKRHVEHGQVTADYVTYCREDVEASQQLTQAAVTEFLRHPIALPATRAYSPATIGKGYLKRMGITPPASRGKSDPVFAGQAMSAYYGGRAECRIRRAPVPVVYCDFKSMYPTVCSLLGLSAHLTSEIDTIDATDEIRQLIDGIDADGCFERGNWTKMTAFAQIQPDGDVLPVRAAYGAGPSFGIGVNSLTSAEAMWFAVPDLIASKLLTGKSPKIIRALQIVPGKPLPGLQPASLLGDTIVDPRTEDFFNTVIEQRTLAQLSGDENRSKGLKTLANATSYGIYAQMTRRELGALTENVTVYGYQGEPFARSVNAPEEPGDYCYPPFAALITAGARLKLALTEQQVTSRGGTYAFCDTDSMAIVATSSGGLTPCPGGEHRTDDGTPAVRALSWTQVDEITDRFKALNPYDPAIVPGSILELENENRDVAGNRRQLWCYAISAKRYTFYVPTPSGPQIVKPSQHGLGHLLNPVNPQSEDRDWIRQTWEWILRGALGLSAPEPSWLDVPAVGRLSVSSPHLHRLLGAQNEGRGYAEQIKPFGFLGIAFVSALERPADEPNMVLIAPFSTNPREWLTRPWINRYTGAQWTATLTPSNGAERPGLVTVKSYRDMLAEYETHPEPKSAAPEGGRCIRTTVGLLGRRHAAMNTITHIGKEANSLDSVTAGLIQRTDEIQSAYDDTSVLKLQAALPALRELGPREVSRRTGISVASVHGVLSKGAIPRATARAKYLAAAAPPQPASDPRPAQPQPDESTDQAQPLAPPSAAPTPQRAHAPPGLRRRAGP